MAENVVRGRLGRILTAVGIIWIIWSFISGSGLIDLQFGNTFVDLPLLPGIVLVFLGRVLGRNSGGTRAEDEAQVTSDPAPAEAPPAPTPRPRPRVVEIQTDPEPEARVLAEAIGDMDDEIARAVDPGGPRKTSAEMVAEARERFGRRP